MNLKKTISLRIPKELKKEIENIAKKEFRSTNSQIEYAIIFFIKKYKENNKLKL